MLGRNLRPIGVATCACPCVTLTGESGSDVSLSIPTPVDFPGKWKPTPEKMAQGPSPC